jgi:hypothetical protein
MSSLSERARSAVESGMSREVESWRKAFHVCDHIGRSRDRLNGSAYVAAPEVVLTGSTADSAARDRDARANALRVPEAN